MENFAGPTALFPATGSGILRSMLGNREAIADLIPVDIPVNLTIAAAWYTANNNNNNITVFNCTSGQINKLTWGMFEKYGRATILNYPFEKIIFLPDPRFTTNILVKNGELLCGMLTKANVGSSAGGMIHIVWRDLGPEATKLFMSNT